MAPNPRVTRAYRAMKVLGIEEAKVKPVLKRLLKLYDKNWELIEEENYRVLIDTIFEEEDENPGQREERKKVDEEMAEDEEAHMHDEPVRPLKRLRRGRENQASQPMTKCGLSSSGASPIKRRKIEGGTLPENSSRQQSQDKAVSSPSDAGHGRIEIRPLPPRDGIIDKGKQPLSSQVPVRGREIISERVSPSIIIKEPTVESGVMLMPKKKLPHTYALIIPKDEPVDELPIDEVPIAVIRPDSVCGRDYPVENGPAGKRDGHEGLASKYRDNEVRGKDIVASSLEEEAANSEVATIPQECCSSIEIASSPLGEVKLSLSCGSALGRPDFQLPGRDQLLKMMEDKCLRSYKITDPKFSVVNLLSTMCECISELGTDSNDESQEVSGKITPRLDMLKESSAHDALGVKGNEEDMSLPSSSSNGTVNATVEVADQIPVSPPCQSVMDDAGHACKKVRTNDFTGSDNIGGLDDPKSPKSGTLVVAPQHQLTLCDLRSIHDCKDLTNGEENVGITWVNENNNEFPPSFHYIPCNLVFHEVDVQFSLSRIGVKDCCSSCLGNCLLSSTPCACANKTGGGFAYSAEGTLKKEFLEECIAISRNRQVHNFYCKECPLERSKNDGFVEPCKGHMKRKFIKECWVKCGCGKQCGNRVVQRGITSKLQVFLTAEGKGWGLRTLEDLPKGAFVCEFVGEILTIKELHKRNMQCAKNGECVYPVLLDACWDSGDVKDKEALCLDAASYGNVARFINHRCLDANLIEIPVEVDVPDHHYYHLAFFATRKISAQEELTWDYGIDLDDQDHLVKSFLCRCGSKFCRNMKRSNRSIRSASTPR